MSEAFKPGYHLVDIPKGEVGELSKIEEEVRELRDAHDQHAVIMELVELSDLVGAITFYLERHHPSVTITDLQMMAAITRRAFENGHRS